MITLRVELIVAMLEPSVACRHRAAIGLKGQIPWHCPSDMQRFKALTTGNALLMGVNSWKSIGKALPNRLCLQLSRGTTAAVPGVTVVNSMAEAMAATRTYGEAAKKDTVTLFVGGGNEVYKSGLPYSAGIHMTQVFKDIPDADTYFPMQEYIHFTGATERQVVMKGFSEHNELDKDGKKIKSSYRYLVWR
jgi:dihydrofolate reductase